MNILLLAPHPFYQERGTPIAVDLLLRTLSARGERVDVVTYHEGRPVGHANVMIYRIPRLPFIRNIRPGLSWKKLICDLFMFVRVIRLTFKNRYDVVHSVEESVFMAMVIKKIFGIPYVYDMDSSMAQQVVEKHPALSPFYPLLRFLEGRAVRGSEAVIPVCDSLARVAEKHHPKKLIVLRDVSLVKPVSEDDRNRVRDELGLNGLIVMYAGNLESYQGIDLLLESFARALKEVDRAHLVIIGGAEQDIKGYQQKCGRLGIYHAVRFLGPRPPDRLGEYFSAADILVSPRIKGNNTPMKIYSYLHSGKAVLATNLPSHMEVLNDQVAVMANPSVADFSRKMVLLMQNEALRLQLGTFGKKQVEERYSYESFKRQLDGLYNGLLTTLCHGTTAADPHA